MQFQLTKPFEGTLGKQTDSLNIWSTTAMENGIQSSRECHLITGASGGSASASLLASPQLPCRQQPGAEADCTGRRLFFRSGCHLPYLTKQNSHTGKDHPALASSVQLSDQQKTKPEIRFETSPIPSGHVSNEDRASVFKEGQVLLLQTNIDPNNCLDLAFTSTHIHLRFVHIVLK